MVHATFGKVREWVREVSLSRVIGVYAVISVLINQYTNTVHAVPLSASLWYCDVAMILLACGFFLQNARIITVVFITAVPAQFLWIVDFFLFLGGTSLGRTDAMSLWGADMFWASVHLHAVLIPLAAYGVYRYGFDQNALPSVFIASATLLLITFLFTSAHNNINCVFFDCDQEDPGSGYLWYFMRTLFFWWGSMGTWFFFVRFLAVRYHLFRVV